MVQLVGSSSLGLGKLIDGRSQFVHIRYSDNASGFNMTVEIQPDTKYIGIATNSSETAPTDPSDYSWGRFVGTPGVSSYTWIRYSANEDGSNMTTTANAETKYIGVAITSEDTAPIDHTQYSWALFKGSDGRGVKKTEVSYQKSASGTVIPTGTWLASIPSLNEGEYLWTRTLFTYTDGTTTSTYNVSRNGTSGLGIARTDVHYQKSTSGTVAPTGTWTVTIPTVRANEYLWTRTTITYTDASTSVSYSVGKMGADGKDAQLLYLTASSQIQAFDKDDQPKTTQPITISAKLQNASGTATFVATPYIGNAAQPSIALGGTGNDRTLLPSQWTDPRWTIIAISATLGPLTDTISINKTKDGDSGKTPVVHIAWADSADGSVGFTLELPTDRIPKYRGYYVDYSTVASTDPKKYKWERNPDDTGAEVDKVTTAVESAIANSEEAERLAAEASKNATIAKQEASAAQNAVNIAQGEVSRIEGVIVGVQGDIDTALQEVANQAADLQATKETLEVTYAKKTEVSDVEAALTTEISKKVGELQTTVSENYAAKNEVVAMEGRLQSQITQTAGEVSSVVGKVEKLESDTTEAQQKVDEALEKSAAAQATADKAQANAVEADRKVSAAQSDLNEAKQNLTDTINRVDATEADIAEAQLKVESAQAAVAQAQRDAAEAALAASNAQAAADKAQQDVAALTKRVTSAETAITQNSEQIKLSANKTEEIGNKLNNLQVGGRNLWIINKMTGGIKETLPDNHITGQKECWRINNRQVVKFDIEPEFSKRMYGKTFTFSAWIKYENVVQGANAWNVFNIFKHSLTYKNSSSGASDTRSLQLGKRTGTSDWIKVNYTYTYNPSEYDMLKTSIFFNVEDAQSGTAWITGIKVEEGNKATDWTPAPEDQQSQIDGINTNLSNNYYSKTQTDAAIKLASDSVTTTVRKEVTTEITNVNNKVDNLQVGGTNLIKNTSSQLRHIQPTTWYEFASIGSNKDVFNLANHLGKRLTLRVWIQNPSADSKLQLYFNAPGWKAGNMVKAGQSGYSQLTVDVPATLPSFWNLVLGDGNGAQLDYKELKAEIGDFATSWSPAPEDTQLQIDGVNNNLQNNYFTKEQTEAAITVKADSITQTVSSTYATKNNTIKSSIEEFYQSTSPTALSGGSWSTTQPTWTQGKYIWRRTKNTYGNDSVAYTPSVNGVCITGNSGQNGKGVSSYSVTYQVGTSGTTAPTGTWTTTIPSVPQGQYLWTKMVITYTDNTSSTSYSVSYIPANGQAGATGPAGNGVSSIITEFYLSTSKTTQTGGSWSTTQPTWSPGKYVWTRNKITYTNGSTAYTSPQCSSEWEAVNNIQVGGRNLYSQTKSKIYSALGSTNFTKTPDNYGFVCTFKNLSLETVRLEKLSFDGITFATVSFDAYVNTNELNLNVDICDHGKKGFNVTTSKKRYVNYVSNIDRFNISDDQGYYNGFVDFEFTLSSGQELHIENIMVEHATTNSAWSPAPEDMATAEEMANLTQTVTNQSTKIDQTSSKIDLVASSVTEVGNKLDNLQVGGENYFSTLLQLAFNQNNEYELKTYNNTGSYTSFPNLLKPMKEFYKKEVMLSFDAISPNGETELRVYNSNGSPMYMITYNRLGTISNAWTHFDMKLEVVYVKDGNEAESNKLEFYAPSKTGVKIRNVDIYEGNKPRAYQKPSADLQTNIDRTNTNLTNNYYSKTQTDAAIKLASDSVTTTVRTEITNVNNKVNNLQIGGRNLWIINKTATFGVVKETLPDNHITGQKECWRINNGGTFKFVIEPEFSKKMYGKTFTLSAWVKYDNVVQGTNTWNVFNCFKHELQYKNSANETTTSADYLTLGMYVDSSDWKKITYTHTYNRSGYDMLKNALTFNIEGATSGTAWITGIKVEEGNKATDWTPAPEDMATLTQYTEVKQLADRISSTVYDSSSGLVTKTEQLAGKYAIQNLNSYGDVLSSLNMNGGNVRIKGSLIELDGNVRMQDAFISNLKSNSILVNEIKAQATTIVNAKITNLDASYITSGYIKADRIQVNDLAAISANLGRITSGYIGNSNSYWDLSTGNFFNSNGTNSSVSIGKGKILVSNKTTFDSSSVSGTSYDSLELSTNCITLGNSSGVLELRPKTIGIGGSSGSATILSPGGLRFGYEFNATTDWFKNVDRFNSWYDVSGYRYQSGRFDLTNGSFNTTGGAVQITANSGPVNLQGASANIRNKENSAFVDCYAQRFSSQSAHSIKTDFEDISMDRLLEAVVKTDIVTFRFKNDTQRNVGFVINDDGQSPYKIDDIIVDDNGKSFNSTTTIGVLFGAVKALNKRIEILQGENQLLKAKIESMS